MMTTGVKLIQKIIISFDLAQSIGKVLYGILKNMFSACILSPGI